jgi:hemerythrin superfamily protein
VTIGAGSARIGAPSYSRRAKPPTDRRKTRSDDIHLHLALTQKGNTMVTAKKTAPRSPAQPKDAIAMLTADHKKVSGLFEQFEATRSPSRKKEPVSQICEELTVHTELEEEIFYPAVKAALNDKELVPEANVEHATVKDLIAQVKDAEPAGEEYDAKIKVMSEYVKHHVKEEQTEMFPKARKTNLDMVALRDQMAARKGELLAG